MTEPKREPPRRLKSVRHASDEDVYAWLEGGKTGALAAWCLMARYREPEVDWA
jgi:hypothetical protein